MAIMLTLFGSVLALVLANVPIAVSLGVVAVIALVASHGVDSQPKKPQVI
jgi:C4-dicarboxylate transporter, DctM subunit